MSNSYHISREKHLDHMIKVVPFIVLGYALQCYVIVQVGARSFAVDSLIFLGIGLCLMIAGFITYDLQHKVILNESELMISFKIIGHNKTIKFSQIMKIESGDADQSFSTLVLYLQDGSKCYFFFVDDAAGIKKWIEDHQRPKQQLAA